ncbi:MAG: diguanylate cyclase [Anaerolineaceae bacterium]|nr:diguanylate cyclase [Anaerolineaceae bacterium]
MSWQTFLYILPYLFSTLVTAGVGLYAWRYRSIHLVFPFLYIVALELVWTVGYVFQLISATLPGKLMWNDVQFLGAVFTPMAYFYFSMEYSRHRRHGQRKALLAVLLLGTVLLLLIWTDQFHHLFRSDPHVVPADLFSALEFIDGPLFWLYPFFAYTLLLFATFMLLQDLVTAPQLYRAQIGTMLLGCMIPWATAVITMFKIVPVNLHDATPLAFGLSNLVIAWALFHYRLFDVAPVARDVLIENLADGIVVLDEQMRMVDYNPAAKRILNTSILKWTNRSLVQNYPFLLQLISSYRGREAPKDEVTIRVDNEPRRFEITATPLLDSFRAPRGWLFTFRDITEWKHIEEQLRDLAVTDPLTGLMNRRRFFELAEEEYHRAQREQRPLSLIMFDVDEFKQVNDRFGHQIGDQVLRGLVQQVRKSLRDSDIMARYGGEEFVILLPHMGIQQAGQIAERICRSLCQERLEAGPDQVRISISMGVSDLGGLVPDDQTLDRLLDNADQALYHAKKTGRNRVCVWTGEPFSVG